MEKTTNKKTTLVKADGKSVKEWKPNPNQEKALSLVGKYGADGCLLVDIEIDYGMKIATGIITPLVSKGLLIAEECDRVSDIVYRKAVIGHKTDHVKRYYLASAKVEKKGATE